MICKKGNSENYLRQALFALLFFLLIFAYSENTRETHCTGSPYKFAAELHSNDIATIDVQQFSLLKSLLPINNKFQSKQCNESLQLKSYNFAIHHRIIFLQRVGFFIKPIVLRGIYSCFHYIDTDDLPVLS
jgi:hypothetical protein